MAEDTELGPEPEPSPPRQYHINFDSYPAKNRSRDVFLRDRMCEASKSGVRVGAASRAQAQESGGAAGRVRFNIRRGRTAGDDPVATIQECCSQKPEYRDPHLPMKEILFRLFLAAGNQPMTAEQLRSAAAEWTGYEYGGVTAEAIEQLLRGDDYYGFAPAE